MFNVTAWDTAHWVQSTQVRSAPIIKWDPDEKGGVTPVFYDLDDLTEGELVIENSSNGQAVWGQKRFHHVSEAIAAAQAEVAQHG